MSFKHCEIKSPKDAYYFFPKITDEIDWNPSYPYKTRRFIFEKLSNQDYLPFETTKFEELTSDPAFKTIKIPFSWNNARIRKCLQARQYNIPKAIELITKQINFQMPQIPYDSFKEILQNGFLYLHGLDSHFRPIIIANAIVYMELSKTYTYDHFICAIDYFITFLINNIFIQGQVENWIMICDVTGVSLLKPPISLIHEFTFLSLRYLCRLGILYIYGMSSMLNFCWSVIKKFIDEGTMKKFVFVNTLNKDEIFNHVNPCQLEKKYGGTCENRTEYDDIFYLPSNEYLTVNDNRARHLISEEEYIDKVIEGKVINISPYLKDEIRKRRELNGSLYSVALSEINIGENNNDDDNDKERIVEYTEASLETINNIGDDYDDMDNYIRILTEVENEFEKEKEKERDKEQFDRRLSFFSKVHEDDSDTCDLILSNKVTPSKKDRKRSPKDPPLIDMMTIYETKEENGCCLSQSKQKCCIIY